MNTTINNLIKARTEVRATLKKYRVSWRDIAKNETLAAWEALGGLWKNKRIPDAAKWQRKIRKEWDRKII